MGKSKKILLHICLLAAALLYYSCASVQKIEEESPHVQIIEDTAGKGIASAEIAENRLKTLKGYKEVSSLAGGYPGIVSDICADGDDITFLVNGRKYYYSDGKLLPEEKKADAEKYRTYGFYEYPDYLPPLEETDPAKVEMIEEFINSRKSVPRDNSFLEDIYRGHSFEEILDEIRYINFLKFRFEVHRDLIPRFKAAEREILAEAEKDPDLRDFISSLSEAGSFNWRRANGSRSRSYHSYGIAVDFNPASFGNRQVFWDWSRKFNKEWYSIPYSRRWMVNEKFVSAFEKQGFVWGGKWLFFDNMHFEYRPEILILSGREIEDISE